MKSLCCPRICRVERRGRYRQNYNPTSFQSDGCGLGDLNGSPGINGQRRASALTSTTSVRTKVTWDTNKTPTPPQRNFLTVDAVRSRKPSTHLLLPKDKGERFHLYTNPNGKLIDLSISGPSRNLKENDMTMTSFIENDPSKCGVSGENLN